MNLSTRLARMEANHGKSTYVASIIATDDADFTRQFEAMLLSLPAPGTVEVTGSIGGIPFAETIDVQPHEDALETIQ